jgi:ubiquinol-cytochrome c reductase cytochrome b subunit
VYSNTTGQQRKQINTTGKQISSDRRIGPHNSDIISIIYGSLLGDAHAEFQGKGTRISFQQGGNNTPYLLQIHTIMANGGYCNSSIPIIKTRPRLNDTDLFSIRFSTYSYLSFNSIREQFYTIDRKRIVPIDIERFLTPLALAI